MKLRINNLFFSLFFVDRLPSPDSALAADYDFGENCAYQLVAAETAILKHNFGEAIKLLNKALASKKLTENETVAANLKLSETLRRNGQTTESSSVMEKIERDYSSASAVAAKLALSRAEQQLDSGNVEGWSRQPVY